MADDALRFFPRLPPGGGPFMIACLPVCRASRQEDWIRALLAVRLAPLAVRLLPALMVGSVAGGLDNGKPVHDEGSIFIFLALFQTANGR